MTFEYQGSLEIPIFYIGTSKGAYALLPTSGRPGGPVVFTSIERLQVFLRYHEKRWGPIEGAIARQLPLTLTLGSYREQLRKRSGATPLNLYLHIDARPAILPGDDLDSDYLSLY